MAAEVITDYIKFCEDMIIPGKEIKIFPNSKPWVNKDIRELLKRKHHSFITGDLVEKRRVQKRLCQQMLQSKREYGNKVEGKFCQGNPKDAWQGIKTIIGCGKRNNLVAPPGDI